MPVGNDTRQRFGVLDGFLEPVDVDVVVADPVHLRDLQDTDDSGLPGTLQWELASAPAAPYYCGAMTTTTAPLSSVPDALGHFGPYGGTFVPETLIGALQQL